MWILDKRLRTVERTMQSVSRAFMKEESLALESRLEKLLKAVDAELVLASKDLRQCARMLERVLAL